MLPNAGAAYQAKEESGRCSRMCCNPNHELTLHVTALEGGKTTGTDVVQVHKPFKCCCPAVCPCFRKELTITKMLPEKKVIGFVKQPWFAGCCKPKLDIFEYEGGKQLGTINGPCCCMGGCCSSSFSMTTDTEDERSKEIAEIKRGGIADNGMRRALLTDADKFSINFMKGFDSIENKWVLISSVLMVDYMFFEGETNCLYSCCVCPPYCWFKLCDLYCCGCTLPVRCKCCVPEAVEAAAAAAL